MLGSVETFKIKPHETTHAQINSNFGCLDNEITIFNQSSKFNGFDAIAQTECLNWSHTPSKEENLEMNKLHSELEIQNNSFVYYLFLVYVIGQFVIVIFFLIFFFFKNKSINIR
jgi:hypothetical protein